MKKCEEKMLEAIRTDIESRFSNVNEENLIIGTAGAGLTKEQQQGWRDMVAKQFPSSKVFYNPLAASIGCHTGPGAVGIGVSVQ